VLATSIFIILAVVAAAVLIALIIWRIRSRRFRPSADIQRQQMELNADLKDAGFAYEINGDYFYSLMDCWQREVGYCRLYDEAAPMFNMIIDCEPVEFSYGGKRWMIELWKGQYGITTGGEIGIYNTEREDIEHEKFRGTFYENIRDDERLPLSYVLRKNGKVLLRRKAVHWWLTGFKLGEFSETDTLTMDASITFPNREMRDSFIESLRKTGYRKREFSVRRNTVNIHYTAPHSVQPEARDGIQEALVQKTNKNNCRLYEFITEKYPNTLDKIEYIKAVMPELYTIFVDSLYAKGIYEAFGWIKDWLTGKRPEPRPQEPPCPPEPPCLPKPPCPPKPSCPSEPPCHPCDSCPPRQQCDSNDCCCQPSDSCHHCGKHREE